MQSASLDFDNLCVVGWPRSGTHHMADLLRFYFDMPDDWDAQTLYCSPELLPKDSWGVYLYRDPRDILVSRYIQLHMRFPGSYQKVVEGRSMLKAFVDWFIDGGDPHVKPPGITWNEFVSSWDEFLPNQSAFVPMKHESLVADRKGELEHLLRAWGVCPINTDTIQKAYDDAIACRRYQYKLQYRYWDGQEQDLLPGIPGEWKRLMDIDTAHPVQYHCGEWMMDKGYIDSPEWWKVLESEEECPT